MKKKCSFPYFSTVAKLLNLWRQCGRKVYEAWEQYCVDNPSRPRATGTTLRAPPKCISGRWGQI
eukprot:9467832-Pyramimonas_sp.AAC.1